MQRELIAKISEQTDQFRPMIGRRLLMLGQWQDTVHQEFEVPIVVLDILQERSVDC